MIPVGWVHEPGNPPNGDAILWLRRPYPNDYPSTWAYVTRTGGGLALHGAQGFTGHPMPILLTAARWLLDNAPAEDLDETGNESDPDRARST